MAKSYRGWYWRLVLASLLTVGGAISFSGGCAWSQIVGDNTLESESSQVTSTSPGVVQIDGGATRGTSLFHSFEQFSVTAGGAAYFNNAFDIQNIISRVTGASISNIDGLIRANGTANLFLLNPNGIVFGPDAALNINGSFVASTASSLNFLDRSQFSATAPQNTSLTISVPIGLQYGRTVGSINQSQASLQVQPGATLALLGGDVILNGGFLQAPGGLVELGGVLEAETIGLNVDGNNLELSFPQGVQRADVALTNGADIDVRTGGGGSIAISARNLQVLAGSRLRAGIASRSGSAYSLSGNITLNITEAITIANNSLVSNNVESGAQGNSGEVNITTGSLDVTDGAQLATDTSGNGNAGIININARDTVSFDGVNINRSESGAFSRVLNGGEGNRGEINITTGSLDVTNGAQLGTNTRGNGDAGIININARDTVSFDGVGRTGFPSRAIGRVRSDGEGKGGDINITTGSLAVTDGAELNVQTEGEGNAGSININARDTVSFDAGNAFSTVEQNAEGDGGDINITTRSLFMTNGARLDVSTSGQRRNAGSVTITARDTVFLNGGRSDPLSPTGAFSSVESRAQGNSGEVNITTGSLYVTDGAQLATDTMGNGNAGIININARDTVSFDGVNSNRRNESGAFSRVLEGEGNSGEVNITTGSLYVTNGAQLGTNTRGNANAGIININARDTVSFDGVGFTGNPSRAVSRVRSDGEGKAGDINITTGSLSVTNGAELNVQTEGQGNAGSMNINARDIVSFDAGNAFSTVEQEAEGNGGDINITTRLLSVINGAQLGTSSEGHGAAGNIEVTARSIQLDNQGKLNAETRSGDGGDITLQLQDLLLMNHNSQISTTAGTAQVNGDGGNITIDAPFIVASPSENNDITANAFSGRGGRVNITAQGIFGLKPLSRQELQTLLGIENELEPSRLPSSDITAISQTEPSLSGQVTLNTPDVDPSRGLVTLPTNLVDVSGLLAQSCRGNGRAVASEQNQFIVTGRGGLPPSPNEVLSSQAVWQDLRPPAWQVASRYSSEVSSSESDVKRNPQPSPIVEAQGWIINNKGKVVLTAQAPVVTLHVPWLLSTACHMPEPSS